MKFIFALLLFFLFYLNISAQPAQPEKVSESGITEISLARSDSEGNAGEKATIFSPADIPIYCLIKLASVESVTVKMNFVIIGTAGLKPDRTVVSVIYKTDGKQTGITFTASPDKIWTAGKYRADISLNGKLTKSLDFEIQSLRRETEKEKPAAPKQKPKTNSKKRKS